MNEPNYEEPPRKHCPVCSGGAICVVQRGPTTHFVCNDCGTEAPIPVWQGRRVAQGDEVNRTLAFESRLGELIQEYAVTGITVVELVGVLDCVKFDCLQRFKKVQT